MSYKRATWRNGKRVISGSWIYSWASDTFAIFLDSRDRVTGMPRVLRVHGETPEWGNWKLVREPGP